MSKGFKNKSKKIIPCYLDKIEDYELLNINTKEQLIEAENILLNLI